MTAWSAAVENWPTVWRTTQVSELRTPQRQRIMVFSLALAYGGSEPQTFTFSNGQRFDFMVLNGKGEELWRWSRSRAFIQMIGQETLAPRELRIYTALWDGKDDHGRPLPEGDYFLQAVWTTMPPAASDPVPFHFHGL